MRLDDLIQLGKTVPEIISDGRETVCSVFCSSELSSVRTSPLLRIYPLSRRHAPPRWSKVSAELKKNPRDNRFESWQLAGDRHEQHETINQRSFSIVSERVDKTPLADVIDAATVGSIVEANEKRLSLAFIRPQSVALNFDMNPQSETCPQFEMFDDHKIRSGSKRFPFLPRLHFLDSEGFEHNLQLRDWGSFEYLRKHQGEPSGLESQLGLTKSSVLLVGNNNRHRTSWLVISVLNGIHDQLCLDQGSVTSVQELLPA
jgi:hypothetical protein